VKRKKWTSGRQRHFTLNRVPFSAFVILALLVFGVTADSRQIRAAEPTPFRAFGRVTVTAVDERQGTLQATLEGCSKPGGPFVGELVEDLVGIEGQAAVGEFILFYDDNEDGVFGGTGDSTLTFIFGDETASFPLLHGGWHITNGDGQFDGAIGGGSLSGELVELDGQTGLPVFETELIGVLVR
jgi:hypothetical protein